MKKCVLFAGMPGSGKSTIAGYLSWNLNIPILATDVIRSEVHQDKFEVELDVEEFNRRRDFRFEQLVNSGNDFIMDGSIDRRWPVLKPKLDDAGYSYFIISFDYSDELTSKLVKLYPLNWGKSPKDYRADHQEFLDNFSNDISLTINDDNYASRLDQAESATKTWLGK